MIFTWIGLAYSAEEALAGARKWTDGDTDAYCIEAEIWSRTENREMSVTYLVTAPAGDGAAPLLVDSIVGEIEEVYDTGGTTRLPRTGLEVSMPDGWSASAGDDGDRITGPGGELTVRRARSCDQVLQLEGAREAYAPSWLFGWRGVVDTTTDAVVLCVETDHDRIQVDTSVAMFQGRHRQATYLVIDILRARSDSYRASEHRPLLPFPIGLALRRVDGHLGAHLSVNVSRFRDLVGVKGEVGYDGSHGLSYDARLTLGLPIKGVAAVTGIVGIDQIGTGDGLALGREPYYGVGVRLGKIQKHRTLHFTGEYLLRHQPDAPDDGTELDEKLYPDREIRLGVHMLSFDRPVKFGFLWGFDAEYRNYGGRDEIVLGIVTRL